MKIPTKKRKDEILELIANLCKEISVPVVCALAAAHADWIISVDRPGKDDIVHGFVVGDKDFVEGCRQCPKGKP